MALVVANRVQETTTTTGTGTVTLAGAVAGYQSFAAIGDGNTTYYTLTSGNNWEVGIGTYTASGTTLARTTVLASSAGGTTKITLSGTSNVFVTYPSDKALYTDASGNAIALGTPASGTVTNLTGTASININGTVGATTPGTGAFTTLSASGTASFGATINSGTGVSTGAVSFELGTSRTGDGNTLFDFHSTSGSDYEARILRAGGVNGALQILQTGSGGIDLNTGSGTLAVTGGASASGGINSTAIGATTASTGAFTTLGASGVVTLTNATASSGRTSGALIMSGGLGTTGAIYASSLAAATGTITKQGGYSGVAWTSSGAGFLQVAQTFTDTTSSGTVATLNSSAFLAPTFAFSNSTTVTNAHTFYVGDPVAGTNAILTNKWAAGFDSIRVGTSNHLTVSTTGALTYGGVTLSNSVTGTGSMALSASPTFTGTLSGSSASFTSATNSFGQTSGAVVITGGLGVGGDIYAGQTLVTNAAAGTTRRHYFQTATSNRFALGISGDAESGSNAGSNFTIARYSDAGAVIDNAMYITRSTGSVAFANGINSTTIGATTPSTGAFTTATATSLGLNGTTPTSTLHTAGTITTSSQFISNNQAIFVSSNTAGQFLNYKSNTVRPSGASLTNLYQNYSSLVLDSSTAIDITTLVGNSQQIYLGNSYARAVTYGFCYNAVAPFIGSGVTSIPNYYSYSAAAHSNGNGLTSGTNLNYQFLANALTGSTAGGTLYNIGFGVNMSTGGSTSGVTNNYGIYIAGNGGTASGGTVTNYAVYSSGTAPAYFAGGLTATPIGASSASTGAFTTLSTTGALTYGGVTLSNSVTGTGSMALSASPTFTGTANFATVSASTSVTCGNATLGNDSNGSINIGAANKSPYIDWNSYNGALNDYDVRMQVTGGSGTSGNGVFTLTAATFAPTGLVDISGAAAGQIKFPATQNASSNANTLDDYEEGTFTPTLTFGGGSTGITYVYQIGSYTKIGNAVTLQCYVRISSKGSSAGAAAVTGLPFTSYSGTAYYWAFGMYFANLAATGTTCPMVFMGSNSTTVNLRTLEAGIDTALTDVQFGATTETMFTGTYHTPT